MVETMGGLVTDPGSRHAVNRRRILERGWLKNAPAGAAEQLLDLCVWRKVPSGDAIYQIENESGNLFAVADGQVAVTQHQHGHLDTGNIHLYRAGAWFGYTPIVRGEPRRIQTVARTDCVLAMVVENRLRRFLLEQPEHWQLLALIADSQAMINGLAALDLARRSPFERLCAVLLRLAGCRLNDGPDGPPFDVAATQTELAESSNLSRNATAGLLKRLERDGLIDQHYRHVAVLQPGALRALLSAT